MPKRTVYDVEPRSDGRWAAQKRGTERAANVYESKKEAVARGRELAKKAGEAQLVVRTADGKIETEYTYGTDPYPPKG